MTAAPEKARASQAVVKSNVAKAEAQLRMTDAKPGRLEIIGRAG